MARNNLAKIGHKGYLWKDTLLDGMRFYEENRKYMVNALKHQAKDHAQFLLPRVFLT